MPGVCFCPGCKSGYKSDTKKRKKNGEKIYTIFCAPKDPELFKKWQRVIPRVDRSLKPTDSVCERHFKEEDITYHQEPLKLFDGSVYLHMYSRPKLKKDAVPSIFPEVPGHSTYVPKVESDDKIKKGKKRKRRSESAKQSITKLALSNSSGTEITGTKRKCFRSKEKENVLETDFSILPRVILNCKTPEPSIVFASLNQLSKSIANGNFYTETTKSIWYGVTNNKSEETNEQAKVPERVSSFSPKSSFSHSSEITYQDVNFTDPEVSITNGVVSEEGVNLPLSVTKGQFSFNFLKANVNAIKKMNSWWTVDCFHDFIVCARWNSDCLVERKIVIYEDLKIKVFLKEKKTNLGNGLEATSFETISHLIFKVERLRFCANILKNEGNCFGFLQADCRCKRRNLCLNCIKWVDGK